MSNSTAFSTKSLNEIFKDFNPNDKTAVYVDAANLHYSCNSADIRMDYDDLKDILSNHMSIRSLSYFTAVAPHGLQDETFVKAHKFNTFLENNGWRVYRKIANTEEIAPGMHKIVKGNVDVDLAATMIDDTHCSAGNIDRVIIFSGDKDYVPAVKILKRYVRVTVISSAVQLSKELKLAADDIIYLEDLKPYVDFRRFNAHQPQRENVA